MPLWRAFTMSRFKRPAVLAGLCVSALSLFVLTRTGDNNTPSHDFLGAAAARRLLRGDERSAGEEHGSFVLRAFRRLATPRAPPGHPYFTDDEQEVIYEAAAASEEHGGGGSHHRGHYWHKPLHPIDGWDVTGVGLACIGLMIAAAGGIGGGGILVPLYILVLGFDPKHAIPLSNITIFGGAITNTVLNLSKRHPNADRPLVDWDLILVMEPLTSECRARGHSTENNKLVRCVEGTNTYDVRDTLADTFPHIFVAAQQGRRCPVHLVFLRERRLLHHISASLSVATTLSVAPPVAQVWSFPLHFLLRLSCGPAVGGALVGSFINKVGPRMMTFFDSSVVCAEETIFPHPASASLARGYGIFVSRGSYCIASDLNVHACTGNSHHLLWTPCAAS